MMSLLGRGINQISCCVHPVSCGANQHSGGITFADRRFFSCDNNPIYNTFSRGVNQFSYEINFNQEFFPKMTKLCSMC